MIRNRRNPLVRAIMSSRTHVLTMIVGVGVHSVALQSVAHT